MNSSKIIETERLFLRPSDDSDAAFFLALLNTPKWLKNIGDRKVRTMEDALEYVDQRVKPQWAKLGYGNYTVVRKSDDVKLGSCGLYDREGVDGIDIGFALFPEYEKQGYAYECTSALKERAINEFGIKKLSAITIRENIASQKLLEKLGLRFVREIEIPNDDEILLLYELS
jgi:RimJ/RimL family protein N-acetyltransferase